MQRRSLFRISASLALLGSGFGLTACGGGAGGPAAEPDPGPAAPPPASLARTVAYVVNAGSADISVYQVEAGGGLSPVGSVPAVIGSNSIDIHPSGRLAFASNTEEEIISIFAVDPATGMLTPKVAFADGGHQTRAVHIHPSGSYLYANSYDDTTFTVYSVDPDTGTLEWIDQRRPGASTSGRAVDFSFDASGRFVYVASFDGYAVSFSIRDTGQLTLINRASTGESPMALAVTPSGKFLYTANGVGGIGIHAIDAATGVVGEGNASFVLPDAVRLIAIEPTGRFVYAASKSGLDEAVFTFKIDATDGSLDLMGTLLTPSSRVTALAIHPSGQFVYATNETSASVSIYSVNQDTGVLTEVGSAVPAGTRPIDMRIISLAA